MKTFIFIFLSFFISQNLFANDYFTFEFDHTAFKGSDNKCILELYFSFNKRGLKFIKENNIYESKTTINVDIRNKTTDEQVFTELYGMPTSVSDTSGNLLDQKLIGQLTFQLVRGEYIIRLTGTDENDTNNFKTIEREINLNLFEDPASISEIQVSSGISKSENKQSAFYKNTLEITPNPELLFGNNLNRIFYYYELYGLKSIGSSSGQVNVKASVKDLNNVPMMSNEKKVNSNTESIADYGMFRIDSLPSSSYVLSINVTDESGNIILANEKKFFLYNSGITQDIAMLESGDEFLVSEYATMREEIVDADFELALYLRDLNESNTYRRLTSVEEKRRFMFNFWKKRDANPNIPQNEFKIEYIKRITEANKLFNEPFRDGWRTDRGRIYVTYGKPDNIDRYPFEQDKVGYEVWGYNSLEGGVVCVFGEVQPSGSGIYDLIHSTIRGELRNDNWEAQLKR